MYTVEEKKKIADNLKRLRRLYWLTTAQVAVQTGIPVGTIRGYENGQPISDERLKQLAEYYEVHVSSMMKDWSLVQAWVPRAYLT